MKCQFIFCSSKNSTIFECPVTWALIIAEWPSCPKPLGLHHAPIATSHLQATCTIHLDVRQHLLHDGSRRLHHSSLHLLNAMFEVSGSPSTFAPALIRRRTASNFPNRAASCSAYVPFTSALFSINSCSAEGTARIMSYMRPILPAGRYQPSGSSSKIFLGQRRCWGHIVGGRYYQLWGKDRQQPLDPAIYIRW